MRGEDDKAPQRALLQGRRACSLAASTSSCSAPSCTIAAAILRSGRPQPGLGRVGDASAVTRPGSAAATSVCACRRGYAGPGAVYGLHATAGLLVCSRSHNPPRRPTAAPGACDVLNSGRSVAGLVQDGLLPLRQALERAVPLDALKWMIDAW